jgi:energy-coupling factor transporter transmembrane protein EcfT
MSANEFPDDLESRFRWAIQETGLIASIFLVWILIGMLIQLALFVLAIPLQVVQIDVLRFLLEIPQSGDVIWALVMPLAAMTTGLYVLVRAGTILIDRYQSSA